MVRKIYEFLIIVMTIASVYAMLALIPESELEKTFVEFTYSDK